MRKWESHLIKPNLIKAFEEPYAPYSIVVKKEGNYSVARDADGKLVKKNTDAATVIQSAIDALTEGGKLILIGKFDISSTINLGNAINLCGIGMGDRATYEGGTVLYNTQTDGSPCLNIDNKTLVRISDMQIAGNSSSGDGIRISNNSRVTLQNLYIKAQSLIVTSTRLGYPSIRIALPLLFTISDAVTNIPLTPLFNIIALPVSLEHSTNTPAINPPYVTPTG